MRLSKKLDLRGYLDLRIKTKNFLVVAKLKSIRIHYLYLDATGLDGRARELMNMSLDEILKLKISKFSPYNPGKSTKEFVNTVVGPQLKGSVQGSAVEMESVNKEVRAFAVVIIGNRKVLVRGVDRGGRWRTDGYSPDWFSEDGFCLAQPVRVFTLENTKVIYTM